MDKSDERHDLTPSYQILGSVFHDDKEKLVFSPVARGVKAGLHSEKSKCLYVKFILAIAIAFVVIGGGVIVCMEVASRTGWYSIEGKNEIVCSTGKPPICDSGCPALHEIVNGKYACSNGTAVSSTCSFTCDENYQLKGNSSATCLDTRKWSTPEPECECPACSIGPKCEYSINWKDVIRVLQFMKPYQSITVYYGGQSFTCSTHLHSILITYTGICTDMKTGISKRCSGYESARGSARHAASGLVQKLAASGIYPSPCDPGDMDTTCSKT